MRESDLSLRFLAQGEQRGAEVAAWLAAFLAGTRRSLDIAAYDFRLSGPQRESVTSALGERARAGVGIRIAYDADKPSAPDLAVGMDPAPSGTGAFVQSLGYPWRRIGGMKLMHNKYIVRDAGLPSAAVCTGSTNFTDDAWTLMENNIVVAASPELASSYVLDFEQLWQAGSIENTGDFDPQPVMVAAGESSVSIQVMFSPGRGPAVDDEVARLVASAHQRVRICSMLLNSGALLNALGDVLRAGRVPVDGIYDRIQMAEVLQQWQEVPHNHWKIGAVQGIVRDARLVGKNSTPYNPAGPHDFMHNKVLVVDDTVITGSYNFSHSAELNAENILLIQGAAVAEQYSAYIDHLLRRYGGS